MSDYGTCYICGNPLKRPGVALTFADSAIRAEPWRHYACAPSAETRKSALLTVAEAYGRSDAPDFAVLYDGRLWNEMLGA